MPAHTKPDLKGGMASRAAALLQDTFPHDAEALQRLGRGDADFGKLAARFQALDRAIYRFETEVERCSDFHVERLKKQRLGLLDEIAVILEHADAKAIGKEAVRA